MDTDISVDSLPYVDREIDAPGVRSVVDKLIEQEMKKTPRRDRSTLPTTIELFKDNPLLSAEWVRTQQKQPLPPLDQERYQLNLPPEDERGDAAAWKQAVDNSSAHLEAQNLRLVNLELLQKFGANAWRLHNYQLEQQLKQTQRATEESRQRIVELNRQRKAEQTEAGKTLHTLESRWTDLISATLQVEVACASLEQEVAQMRDYQQQQIEAEQLEQVEKVET